MPDFAFYHHGIGIHFPIEFRPLEDRPESRLRSSFVWVFWSCLMAGMWDFSSLTRYQTCASCSGSPDS